MSLRTDISAIIGRRIPEKGYDKTLAEVARFGAFGEAQREKVLILIIKEVEKLREELDDLRSDRKGRKS